MKLPNLWFITIIKSTSSVFSRSQESHYMKQAVTGNNCWAVLVLIIYPSNCTIPWHNFPWLTTLLYCILYLHHLCHLWNVMSIHFQLSSLSKHRDDQDTKEANTLQFKSTIDARYVVCGWNYCCVDYHLICAILRREQISCKCEPLISSPMWHKWKSSRITTIKQTSPISGHLYSSQECPHMGRLTVLVCCVVKYQYQFWE